ncbi:hypothetical protein JW865_09090 [Candidatus Bathyarchaeota archaeon]|nr:hypothetical protein [Candidatus Bathyarchaeota archaeon]
MKKNNIFLFIIISILILTLININVFDVYENIDDTKNRYIDVSWVKKYTSLKDLYNDSYVVIIGEVLSTNYRNILVKSNVTSVPFTDFVIKINSVLKGFVSNDTIVVSQTGGLLNDVLFMIRDDPLMQNGDKVILFLNKEEKYGSHFILGGPQGRFVILNDHVFSIGELQPQTDSITKSLWTKGITLDDFTDDIRS